MDDEDTERVRMTTTSLIMKAVYYTLCMGLFITERPRQAEENWKEGAGEK